MSDQNEYLSEDDVVPEPVKIEITFKDVELTKIDVKPGDTLAMIIKSDDMNGMIIDSLKQSMTKAFPGIKVLLFGVGLSDSINFTVFSENKAISSCATGQFCVDCNCGKKEAALQPSPLPPEVKAELNELGEDDENS